MRLPVPERVPWLWAGFWLFWPLAWIAGMHLARGFDLDDPQDWLMGQFLAAQGVVLGLMHLIAPIATRYLWRIVVTDRRVSAWRGMLRREAQEIRRSDIERATLDGDDLLVHGDGRALRLDLRRVSDAALQAALGGTAPPPGRQAGSLKRILQQGERVILRHPAIRNWAIPAAMTCLLAVLLLFWTGKLLGWFSTPSPPGSPAGLAVILLAVPILLKLYLDATWSAVVTNRRVLLRRLHDRTRYDELPLDAIEEIEAPHEGSHRVYLHACGQRYEFRPRSLRAAERMYAAIRRAMGRPSGRG